MKYIVETLQAFRHVHVVEAENEKEAELYKYIKRPSKCRREISPSWQKILKSQSFRRLSTHKGDKKEKILKVRACLDFRHTKTIRRLYSECVPRCRI